MYDSRHVGRPLPLAAQVSFPTRVLRRSRRARCPALASMPGNVSTLKCRPLLLQRCIPKYRIDRERAPSQRQYNPLEAMCSRYRTVCNTLDFFCMSSSNLGHGTTRNHGTRFSVETRSRIVAQQGEGRAMSVRGLAIAPGVRSQMVLMKWRLFYAPRRGLFYAPGEYFFTLPGEQFLRSQESIFLRSQESAFLRFQEREISIRIIICLCSVGAAGWYLSTLRQALPARVWCAQPTAEFGRRLSERTAMPL